ncbi:hypothetical protein [uncultured Veillonella sp.]|uniref:hypothetical protein n=1 Tax=uncultured Veillonella sp. TaxID=159268 RepID=UPI0025E8CC8C|nr:hypothetical protein [uncultured Veillonella sp.]
MGQVGANIEGELRSALDDVLQQADVIGINRMDTEPFQEPSDMNTLKKLSSENKSSTSCSANTSSVSRKPRKFMPTKIRRDKLKPVLVDERGRCECCSKRCDPVNLNCKKRRRILERLGYTGGPYKVAD